MKKIAKPKRAEPFCCGGKRKWRAKDKILLLLAVAIAISQIYMFSRHWDHHQAANENTHGDGDKKNSKTIQNKLLKQQQERMDLSNFAVSMSSDRRNETRKESQKLQFAASSLDPSHTNASKNRIDGSDGVFNGYPIYLQHANNNDYPIHSQLHCVGETWHPPHFWKRKKIFQDASWQHRSCHFQFFCYDVDEKEFVIYLNQKEQGESSATLSHLDDHTGHWDVSQTYFRNMTRVTPRQEPAGKTKFHVAEIHHPYGVSIGSINGKWAQMGIPRLQWFPKVKFDPVPINNDTNNPYVVYTLPSSVVMIPFHSLAASNPGHLVWDDFLPLYTLMQIFGFANDDPTTTTTTTSQSAFDLLLLRFVLPPEAGSDEDRGLWAGCDWLEEKAEQCQKMLHKFAPLMIREQAAWQTTTQRDPTLEFFNDDDGNNNNNSKKKLICAKNGLAGLGGLSDHGTDKGHGWEER